MNDLNAKKIFTAILVLMSGYYMWEWFIQPLWASLFFSVMLVVSFYKFFTFLNNYIRPSLSAMSVTLIAVVVVVGPLTIAIYFAASTIVDFATAVQDIGSQEYDLLAKVIDKVAVVFPFVHNLLSDENGVAQGFNVQENFKTVGQYSGVVLNVMYSSLIDVAIWLSVIIFGMYYLLLYGEEGKDFIADLAPVGEKYITAIYQEFVDMARTLTKVTVIIGLTQGSIGGCALWYIGAESWYMWTMVMIIFSMVPILGAGIVLAPTAIIYFLLGEVSAVIVLATTLFIVANVDNYLKPKIVSGSNEINPGIVLLATLSGTIEFGPIGFFAGPIIMTLIIAILKVYKKERNEVLASREKERNIK